MPAERVFDHYQQRQSPIFAAVRGPEGRAGRAGGTRTAARNVAGSASVVAKHRSTDDPQAGAPGQWGRLQFDLVTPILGVAEEARLFTTFIIVDILEHVN